MILHDIYCQVKYIKQFLNEVEYEELLRQRFNNSRYEELLRQRFVKTEADNTEADKAGIM